ncbi:MAG TPA: histidine kinase N-terminal 7TM domain-containing protein, partial [Anaerolineales bacterium]|nr:histidine kinase N-terminal 7TM domain-containing protein [Anaerolineales bacterium]
MPGRTPKRHSMLMVGLDGIMDERAYTFVFLITFTSTFLTAFLALYAWRYRETRAAASFAWLMIAVTVWSLAIAVGMISAGIEQAYFWIVVRMISVLIVPVLWLIFALEFTNNAAWPNRGYIFLLFAVPILSLAILLTNDWHSLFITDIVYRRAGFYLIDLTWSLGPWFWVNFIYSYSLIAVGMFALLREALRLSRQYRRQALAILVGALFPLVTNFILTSRWIVQLEANLD